MHDAAPHRPRSLPSALAAVLPAVQCPHCAGALQDAGGTSLRCSAGHVFDVARQGYVNLRAGGSPGVAGDTPPMVAAREAFLAAGHYDALSAALAEVVAEALAGGPPGPVVDAGAGTGWHLARVLDALPGRDGIAVDVARPALQRAARAHPRAAAVGCDVWAGLPLRTGAAAAVLDVFAPRNVAEFARVLHPAGVLVTVTPSPAHLAELVGPLGLLTVDPAKDRRLEAALGEAFRRDRHREVTATLHLDHAGVRTLVEMTPSGHHLDEDRLGEGVAALPDPVAVTLSVRLAVHRRPDGRRGAAPTR